MMTFEEKTKMKLALLTTMALAAITTQSLHAAPAQMAPSEISQIVITRYTGSDASHPQADHIYRILLKRDGTAIYVGNKTYMKRTGRYRGTISQSDFERLAKLLRQNDREQSSYNVSDGREVQKETFKTTAGNRQRTVVSYQESAPQRFQQASAIAYGLLWKIQWNKVSSSDAISG